MHGGQQAEIPGQPLHGTWLVGGTVVPLALEAG